MALKTFGEQLEEVQNAITAVMSGQGYKINGREMTRANLGELNDREEILLNRVAKYGEDAKSTSKSTMKVKRVVPYA